MDSQPEPAPGPSCSTAWSAVDVDSTKTADGPAADSRASSDPIVLTDVAYVRARVLGPAGSTAPRAALTVIDPGHSAADSAPGRAAAGAASAAASAPRIYSRAEWGARQSLRRNKPSRGRVQAVIVHHTAGTNQYTPSQVPKILRGIYAFHVRGRGWSDIGYNFLIDKWGRIWEGRAGGVTQAVSGAHTAGFNLYTMGVSVMGDYATARPTRWALTSLARVIGWKAALHRMPVVGRVTLLNRRYPRVMGHRDANRTSCPGKYLAAALPSIRSSAAGYAATYTVTVPATE